MSGTSVPHAGNSSVSPYLLVLTVRHPSCLGKFAFTFIDEDERVQGTENLFCMNPFLSNKPLVKQMAAAKGC